MASPPFPLDVVLIAHNHERYIARALESIVRQECPFDFRVLVADDSSDDRTLEIIRQYAERHPAIAFTFLPKSVRLGVTRNYRRAFDACDAEYVAILEGDDYWCNTGKLALQVGFLRDHPECAMCGCNYYILDEADQTFRLRVHLIDGFTVHDTPAIIRDNMISNFSTSIYRREALSRIPRELFDLVAYDWAVNIFVGIHGLLGFLNEPLSVYRIHPEGVWNRMSPAEKIAEQLALIPHYDALSGGQFHEAFEARSRWLRDQDGRRDLAGRFLYWCPPFVEWLLRGLIPRAILRRGRNLPRK